MLCKTHPLWEGQHDQSMVQKPDVTTKIISGLMKYQTLLPLDEKHQHEIMIHFKTT